MMRKGFTLLLLMALTVVRAASADLFEFNGVLVTAGRTQLSLANLATGEVRWVKVGGKFSGYDVLNYDAAQNSVSLQRPGGPVVNVRLKDAVLLVAPAGSPWNQPSNEQRAAIVDNLRQLAAAASLYYATTGADAATLDDLVGPGKPLEQIVSAAGESYANLVLRRDAPALALTTPDGTTINSNGTSIAADGSTITPDGGRISPDGTRYAPDGTVAIDPNPGAAGPFIPPNASPVTARALLAVGWKYRQ
jgi:hypothetical protein